MYDEVRYQVKYYLLMLEPFQKGLIAIEDNVSYDKLERDLEKYLEYYFNDCRKHYPRSTFLIIFEIVEKKKNWNQQESNPLEVCH